MEYPTDYEGVMTALAPYYQAGQPLDFFFALHICAVLDELPAQTLTALDVFSQRHPTFFADQDGDWRRHVVDQLHLSDTIDVAIWDLWIKNRERERSDGSTFSPWEYALQFMKEYFKDDSRVDVWTPESLEAARRRVAAIRALDS